MIGTSDQPCWLADARNLLLLPYVIHSVIVQHDWDNISNISQTIADICATVSLLL